MPSYEHRQLSYWMIVIFAVSAVLTAMLGGLALPLVLVLVATTFSSLSTQVDANRVSWAFALGFPRGAIPVADIADVQITKTNFWEGFGIHWTFWHGWLWNVWGYRAVMIRKRNGGTVTLGTNDPQGLYDAIARFR
jgi:hypothetical protein